MKIAGFILMIFLLNSCGTSQQQKREIAEEESQWTRMASSLNYGPPPPKNYKEHFMSTVSENFYDPYSASFRGITPPKAGWLKWYKTGTWEEVMIYGWIMCGEVNGKNRYGAYVGYSNAVVIYLKGKYTNLSDNNLSIVGNKERFITYCGFVPLNLSR